MTNLETLQTMLDIRIKEAQDKVRNRMEVARIEAKLSMLDNEALQGAQVRAELIKATTERLREIELQCETVVNSMPIYSSRTRENRKWNPSRQYGLGNHVALLTGILSGIQYSASEHKAQMLMLTGLDEDLIEQTLEAFGNVAYYSNNYNIVVDEQLYDMDKLNDNIALIELLLDVQLDKAKLNETVMHRRFEVARIKAETNKAETATAELMQGQVLKLN